jgi:DNA repair protein RecO (recombination protein O)
MAEREHVQLTRGFVLHQRPYRNTSQLLDCLTETHGRVALVAQGTKRGLGLKRALLQPFAPLVLSWLRRGELGRLTHVEAQGPSHDLVAHHLLAGFYASELVLRLLARGDPNSEVFSCYSRCLAELGAGAHVARTLRLFELELLRALGYGLELEVDTDTGEPLRVDAHYLFELERGPRIARRSSEDDEVYSGHELMAMHEQTLHDDASLRAAQRLLGRVLNAYLGERPLQSRKVLKDIVDRGL